MDEHEAVRAGNKEAAYALLERLARQVCRPFKPPADHGSWTRDAVLDVLADAFVAKPRLLEAAIVETVGDAQLERYLLTALRNVLNDQGRQTERGKLIKRLKTLLGPVTDIIRHTSPFDGWRAASCPSEPWQGDLDTLVAAGTRVPGRSAATAWNTSGPTPAATRDVVVEVSRAALVEADGVVRDADVACVVQVCVPAAPLDSHDLETVGIVEVLPDPPERGANDDVGDGSPRPEHLARALWGQLDAEEQVALRHLLDGEAAVGRALGLGRRATAAVVASVKAKVAAATAPETREAVVYELHALAQEAVLPEDDDASSQEKGAAS